MRRLFHFSLSCSLLLDSQSNQSLINFDMDVINPRIERTPNSQTFLSLSVSLALSAGSPPLLFFLFRLLPGRSCCVSPSPSTYTRRNNSLSISHLGDLKSSLSSLILFLPCLCPLLLSYLFPYQHHNMASDGQDSAVSPHKAPTKGRVYYFKTCLFVGSEYNISSLGSAIISPLPESPRCCYTLH